MTNEQQVEKEVHRDNGDLDVVDIWPTIQGEGPFAGLPAVFVRLAGCNLQCPGCDTDYTSQRKIMSAQQVTNEVCSHNGIGDLVVITGGEPFRQNLMPLFGYLVQRHRKVQVETNGTYWPDWADLMWDRGAGRVAGSIVCSPKTPVILIPDGYIAAYKYILKAGEVNDNDGLPIKTLDNECGVARPTGWFPRNHIFVQPYDPGIQSVSPDDTFESRIGPHVKVCIDSVMRFGYRLSYQIHKAIGLE